MGPLLMGKACYHGEKIRVSKKTWCSAAAAVAMEVKSFSMTSNNCSLNRMVNLRVAVMTSLTLVIRLFVI